MIARCIFITFISLLGGCLSTPPSSSQTFATAPPDNRVMPRLPLSDAGLAPDWLLGEWRIGDSGCTLRLEADASRLNTGPVIPRDCTAPWGAAHDWRRPDDRTSLFVIRDGAGRALWRAFAIQPTAIAGADGEGRRVRLYWAEEGTYGGWVQPGRETGP